MRIAQRGLPWWSRISGWAGVLLALVSAPAFAQAPMQDLKDRVDIRVEVGRTTLDRNQRDLISNVDVTLSNRQDTILSPLHLVIETTSTNVLVTGAAGGPSDSAHAGAYYIDLGSTLARGAWMPGETWSNRVTFVRPATETFTYAFKVMGALNQAPAANAGGPYGSRRGESISFTALGSSDPEGQELTYRWDFGDGARSTAAVPTHVYADIGLYNVRLEVEDIYGAVARTDATASVLPTGTVALARTRVLNDVGQPLSGVAVEERGPGGRVAAVSAAGNGYVSLGAGPGEHDWLFAKPDHLTVHRRATLGADPVEVIPSPWLTRRSAPAFVLSPIQAGAVEEPTGEVAISFPAGAFAQFTAAYLTRLSGQALPGLLPPGWSPLSAWWLDLEREPSQPGVVTVDPAMGPAPGESAVLARWDAAALSWEVLQFLAGVGGGDIQADLPSSGVYAVVVADGGPRSPPAPALGAALPAGAAVQPDSALLTAEGRAEPSVSPASRTPALVTAVGRVDVAYPEPLSSGLPFRCTVDEVYRLVDGTIGKTPSYDTFVVAYQRPGDARVETLRASFPLRPLLLLGEQELAEAEIRVDVLDTRAFSGGVMDGGGGWIQGDEAAIRFEPGDLDGQQAVEIRTLPAEDFDPLTGDAGFVTAAFELNVGAVAAGERLEATFAPQLPDRWFVLAKLISGVDGVGLQPIERLRSDASGVLFSEEPAAGPRLDGIVGAGLYLLVEVGAPLGLVTGIGRGDDGSAGEGLQVRVAEQPWLSITDAAGAFALLAPAGSVQVTVVDPSTGNAGATPVQIDPAAVVTVADVATAPSGPRIIATTPGDGDQDVRLVQPMLVAFNKPIDPASFAGNGIRLLDDGGNDVEGSLILNLAATEGSFLPSSPLQPGAGYTVEVSSAVTDRGGLALEGPRRTTFVTARLSTRQAGAQLIVYEPGAAQCPCVGQSPGYEPGNRLLVCVEGAPGVADPDVPVIVVNDTAGATATVRSRADGSFVNFLRADEEDFISATFVNANGTTIHVPAVRQRFDDGAVGFYGGGGILEAESDGGPVKVFVEPGAIDSRATFRVETIPVEDFLEAVDNTPPAEGTLIGSLVYEEEGDLQAPVDLSFPVDVSSLGLPPGVDPQDGLYGLTIPRKYRDVVVYEMVDKMEFVPTEPGKGELVTRSPPYTGLLLRKLQALQQNTLRADALSSIRFGQTETGGAVPQRPQSLIGLLAWGLTGTAAAGTTLSGKVLVGTVDPFNVLEGPGTPLAGAVVGVDFVGSDRPLGSLSPGELVTTSDTDGRFALTFLPSFAGAGRFLTATHPRYPFQQARSDGFLGSFGETAALNIPLIFVEPEITVSDLDGIARPSLRMSHAPAFPAPGPGGGAGFLVSVTDDKQVASVDVSIRQVVNPFSGLILSNRTVQLEPRPIQQPAPSRTIQEYRLTATEPARVTLQVLAFDDLGQSTEAVYPIVFGGTPVVPVPIDPSDTTAVRVVFSWPPADAQNIPSLTPIRIRFNEPISEAFLDQTAWSWIAMGVNHEVRSIAATEDRRELTIYYDGEPDGTVSLTLGAPLTDENGNTFDQSVAEEGTQSYSLSFTQAGRTESPLSGVSWGGGVVLLGRYAYALDRQTGAAGGRLVVVDLEDPDDPEIDRTVPLPGWPTDITLIPRHAFATEVQVAAGGLTSWECRAFDWLAIFTGAANQPKQLTVLPAGSGLDGLLSGARTFSPVTGPISASPASMITKADWDAPFLGYLERGAGVSSIGLLDLNAFLIGNTADQAQRNLFPDAPLPGVDRDLDGDYCDRDQGESPPLPAREPFGPYGLTFSWAPLDPTQSIIDFDFDADFGLVGAVSSFTDGAPAQYETVLGLQTGGPLGQGVFTFRPDQLPKRLLLLPAVEVQTAEGPRIKDLALVSMVGDPGQLVILDITVPENPVEIGGFVLPPGEGSANSIVRRADGLLALATATGTLLLDPGRLLAPQTALTHPSIVGRLDGLGGGVRSFVSDPSGLSLVNSGSDQRLVQDAPRLEFVRFAVEPFAVKDFVEEQEDAVIRARIEQALPVSVALPSTVQFSGSPPPPDPLLHYYVKIDAPGSSGDSLNLVLVAADGQATPMEENVGISVPAVLDEQNGMLLSGVTTALRFLTLKKQRLGLPSLQNVLNLDKIKQKALDFLAEYSEYPKGFTAYRLSDDVNSALYNQYLAGPFILVEANLGAGQLSALQDQLNRHYLRATPYLWVGLSPVEEDNPVLGRFASSREYATDSIIFDPSVLPSTDDILLAVTVFGSGFGLSGLTGLFSGSPLQLKPVLAPGASALLPVGVQEYPLVLVPGVMASYLEDGFERVWPWSSGALEMTADGQSLNPIVPSDLMRKIPEFESIPGKWIYGQLINYLVDELGYVEYGYRTPPDLRTEWDARRRLTGAGAMPVLDSRPRPNLFVFPYDWRFDNQRSAQKLREYVDLALAIHPAADKVDLIGHSMGGLVSRRFMLDNPNRVNRFISIGTPWLGAPKCLLAMKTGDFDDFMMNILVPKPLLRRIGQYMPGVHQLLPAKGLFDLGTQPIVETGWDANTNRVFYEAYDYAAYTNSLAGPLLRDELLSITNQPPARHPAAANHDGFHSYQGYKIGDWRDDTLPIEYHHIFGMQVLPKTIGRLALSTWLQPVTNRSDLVLDAPSPEFSDSESPLEFDPPLLGGDGTPDFPDGGVPYELERRVEIVRMSGDGTVPLQSAARGAGAGATVDLNSPRARLYPVVSPRLEDDERAEHNGMLANDRVHDMVGQILTGRIPEVVPVTVTWSPVAEEGTPVVFQGMHSATPGATGDVLYIWDFGDGGTVTQSVAGGSAPSGVMHTFRDNGLYTVSLGVAFSNGVSGFTSRSVAVSNLPPTVAILGPTNMATGGSAIFSADVTDPGINDTHTYRWDLNGDGAPDFDGGFVVAHAFNTPGTTTVSVVAMDDDGAVGTNAIEVVVEDQAEPPPTPAPRETAGRDDEPSSGGVPLLYVRVAGHRTSFLSRDGLSIYHDDVHAYAPTDAFPTVGNEVGRFIKALAGIVSDNTSTNSVFASVFRTADGDGAPFEATRIECVGKGLPLSYDVLYLEGGEVRQYWRWEEPVAGDDDVSLLFHWEQQAATLAVDGEDREPKVVIHGDAAADRVGPAVVGVLNPATREVFVIGRDNRTAETNLTYFASLDADGNGNFVDGTYFQLTTNSFLEGSAPAARAFTVVARDELGNLSPYTVFDVVQIQDSAFAGASTHAPEASSYCTDLTTIRDTVRTVIQNGLQLSVVRNFLLRADHVWFFEQGTGACLWKTNACDGCDGAYVPKKSDNDYEVFMPVFTSPSFGLNESDRADFLLLGPHSDFVMEGDWYFKPPVGRDATGVSTGIDSNIVSWAYTLPDGFTNAAGQAVFTVPRQTNNTDLISGFKDPLTPAQVITLAITQLVTEDPDVRRVLPDVSFFPFRREHFQYAVMSLERPPPFGDDPIGDAGMGRQMLLLKWLLEGAFVTFEDGDINRGAPSVNDVFANLERQGIPLVEGYEWGSYHEFAALKATPHLVVKQQAATTNSTAVLEPGIKSYFLKRDEKVIKKVGKAAIRATLARLVGDPQYNSRATSIDPDEYQDLGFKSFETLILYLATNDVPASVYGDFAPRLPDFLNAKLADPAFMDSLHENQRFAPFVEDAFRFLRTNVQSNTVASYEQYLDSLATQPGGADEYDRRQDNFQAVWGLPAGGAPTSEAGILQMTSTNYPVTYDLVVQVLNQGSEPAEDILITFDPGSSTNEQERSVGTLAPRAQAVVNGRFETGQAFYLERNMADRDLATGRVSMVASFPGTEPTNNNLLAFTHAVLDLARPAPAVDPPPQMGIYLDSTGSRELRDWPAANNLPRSPRFLISSNDQIYVRVQAQPGLGNQYFEVIANSQSDPAGIVLNLQEIEPGVYQNDESGHALRLGQVTSVSEGRRIAVKDEELLTFTLLNDDEEQLRIVDVMVDRAEFASCGIQRFYHGTSSGARELVRTEVLTKGAYFDVGDGQFPDDVGSMGIANPMRTFILNTRDADAGNGESDFLYVTCHGDTTVGNGDLQDDQVPHALILDPDGNDGVDNTRYWNSDVEWVILNACQTLDPDAPPDGGGELAWRTTMLGERPLHMILGFWAPVASSIRNRELRFFQLVRDHKEYLIDAWRTAMEAPPDLSDPLDFGKEEWAVIYYEGNRYDRLFESTQDQVPNPGSIRRLASNIDFGNPGDCGSVHPKWSGFCSDMEGISSNGVTGAERGEGPSVPVPSRLRIRSERVGNRLADFPRQAVLSDGLEIVQTGKADRGFGRTQLDAEAAEMMARDFVRTRWSQHAGNLRLIELSPRYADRLLDSGETTSWISGYCARFGAFCGGIPIRGSEIVLLLDGQAVSQVIGRLLIGSPDSETTDYGTVLSPEAAWTGARIPVRGKSGDRTVSIVRHRLEYVPAQWFEANKQLVEPEFIPAWQFVIKDPSEGCSVADRLQVVWIDAVSGAPLQVTQR